MTVPTLPAGVDDSRYDCTSIGKPDNVNRLTFRNLQPRQQANLTGAGLLMCGGKVLRYIPPMLEMEKRAINSMELLYLMRDSK
jgi:hypothetical protein